MTKRQFVIKPILFHSVLYKCHAQWCMIGLSLLASAIIFIYRGPLRGISDFYDFTGLYLLGHAWTAGLDAHAFRHKELIRVLGLDEPQSIAAAAYPPFTGVVVAPFAALSWEVAKLTAICVFLLLFLLSIKLSASLAGLRVNQKRTWVFVTLALAFAPVHAAFAFGQPTIPSFAFGLLAVWLDRSKKQPLYIGIFLALSVLAKIHVGGLFVFYMLIRMRWKPLVTCSVFLLIAVAYTELRFIGTGNGYMLGDGWLHWLAKVIRWFGPTSGEHWTPDISDNKVVGMNLHNIFYIFTENIMLVVIVVAILVVSGGLALAIVAIRLHMREKKGNFPDSLALGVVLCLGLLSSYHGTYDNMILLVTLAWALQHYDKKSKYFARSALALLSPFILYPGSSFIYYLVEKELISAFALQSGILKYLIIPIQNWALVLLLLVLILGFLHATKRTQTTNISQQQS